MGKKKAPKPPPPPDPIPIPEAPVEATEQAAKRVRRRGGYTKQIITGALGPSQGGKKSVLG